MPEPKDKVAEIIRDILSKRGKNLDEVNPKASIYSDGLGLDSLDVATLSVKLEREFGHEPFGLGVFPRNIEEIVDFYKGKDGKK